MKITKKLSEIFYWPTIFFWITWWAIYGTLALVLEPLSKGRYLVVLGLLLALIWIPNWIYKKTKSRILRISNDVTTQNQM